MTGAELAKATAGVTAVARRSEGRPGIPARSRTAVGLTSSGDHRLRVGPNVGDNRCPHNVLHPRCDSRSAAHVLAHIYDLPYVSAVPSDLVVLEVIAEPTRRRILDAVRSGERSVSELVDVVGMHQPGVSRHLKVLRDAGLVEVRRDAQRRLYRLRAEPLRELDEWLEPYRAELAGRLDSLERHLERTAAPDPPEGAIPRDRRPHHPLRRRARAHRRRWRHPLRTSPRLRRARRVGRHHHP